MAWPRVARDAPLLSPPRASPKQIFVYAVQGKRGPYVADEVGAIVWTYVVTCTEAGLDPLLVFSQLLLETEHLTSASPNPPAIEPVGAAGPANPAAGPWSRQLPHLVPVQIDEPLHPNVEQWLEPVRRAARVHAGTVLAYALATGAETADQRRLVAEALEWRTVPEVLRGSAPTLERLADVWGADEEYAASIRAIADSILQPQW